MEKQIKIPRELYQFTDETALVIIAAKQEGRVYRAADGELELIEHFRVPTPHFSDNEAMRGTEGKQERKVQQLIHGEYFEHFKKIFHSVAQSVKPTNIYFFSPSHVAEELTEIIKPIFGTVPTQNIPGIFTEISPVELLKRLN